MPRLLGVEIPGNKKIPYALRYIYGIGPTTAEAIVEEGILVEGDLRRDVSGNLKRLQAIQCNRGIRHRRGLPVRGQRTQCNARTRKGRRKTVGIQKK